MIENIKTIKELEAKIRNYTCGCKGYYRHCNTCEGSKHEYLALKYVLGLIDERIKTINLIINDLAENHRLTLRAIIKELEKLKAMITGK